MRQNGQKYAMLSAYMIFFHNVCCFALRQRSQRVYRRESGAELAL